MKAFVLAGGFATRLWPLTESRAKPLLPLAGKPILTHLVEKIPEGIPITVSTNAVFAEQFHQWKSALSSQLSAISILIEDTTHDDHKLGALGAVAQWIKQETINEDVLLLTGDNFLGFSMDAFLNAYKEGIPILAVHDIGDLKKAKHFGVVVAEGNRITKFQEKPKEPASTLVSTGCSILPKEILPILTEFASKHPDNVGGIFEEFLRRNIAIECFTFGEPWLDIGSFHSYLEAHRLLVSEKILKDASAAIHQTECLGSISIGAKSSIKKSTLTDCMIFDNCTIEDCVLKNCIVDDNCELRGIDLTNKMIRSNTVLVRESIST